MFDLGMQELIVIFIVALLVFGPKKLPEIGKTLGKGIVELKKAMSGVKAQIDAEMHNIKDPIALKNEMFKTDDLFKVEEKTVKKEDKIEAKIEAKTEDAKEGSPAVQPESDKTEPYQTSDKQTHKGSG